ncbi:TldD/PmbA family protein [Deinococcus peraridilitoris]|nr:TldD/PmbA family protein [Deinococcus peraridilitoris]
MTFDEARTYLMNRAREQGVQLEVFAQRGSSTSVKAFDGQVSEFKLAQRQGLGLRALAGGAWGYAFTENFSRPALDRALDSALENAALVGPQAHARLIAWGKAPELDLHGEGLSGVTVERKVQAALALEQAARSADGRVKSVPYNAYADSEDEVAVANTAGLERRYTSLGIYQYVSPLVSEDGQHKSKSEFHFTREFEELDPTRTALEATRKSLALLGAKRAPSGHFGAVIDRECMATLFRVYAGIFSGKMVQEGKSPLAGKLGQQVATPLVTLRDDATLARGMASRPFDAEGCPSAPLTLIEGGKLGAFLHNSETAAHAGVDSTGHASRAGYRGTVEVSPTNFFLEPGQDSREDLLRALGSGLLLTAVQGVHAGANPITGEFSLQAEGFWVEEGRVAYPLDVFTVAGNFLELLQEVEAVANDLKFFPSGAGAPSVRVRTLAVGGG